MIAQYGAKQVLVAANSDLIARFGTLFGRRIGKGRRGLLYWGFTFSCSQTLMSDW